MPTQRREDADVEIRIKGRGGEFSFHLLDDDSLTITVDGYEVVRANRTGLTFVGDGAELAARMNAHNDSKLGWS